MLARVVPCKGGGVDWLVGQLIRDLRRMVVHAKVILKSDQENVILDVFNDVHKQTRKENESKGNTPVGCIAERAEQNLEEGVRTHKLALKLN